MPTVKQRYLITKDDDGTHGAERLLEAVHGLKSGRWAITIERYVKRRTNAQNNLLHFYFQVLADETGNSLDRIKDILKKMFLTTELKDAMGEIVCNPKTGEPLTYVPDTSDLNTIEAANFTEEIRMFAQDFGIILPLPESQLNLNY